jgi:hypothetical protein
MSAVRGDQGAGGDQVWSADRCGAINLFSTPIPEPDDGGFGGKLDLFAGEFGTTRTHGVVGGLCADRARPSTSA